MQKLNKNIILAGILIFSFMLSNFVFADVTKDEAFNKLKEKFASAKTISLNFDDGWTKGSLKAAKGNKFILNVSDRKIISNGKDLWNYSEKDKKVMLSEYESSSSLTNIDDILLNFSKSFKPLSLIRENGSKGGGVNVLILQNTDEKALKNISEIKIFSAGDFDDISAIEIKSNHGTRKYSIMNLKINPKIKDSQFDFDVPKGVELIDLK